MPLIIGVPILLMLASMGVRLYLSEPVHWTSFGIIAMSFVGFRLDDAMGLVQAVWALGAIAVAWTAFGKAIDG